MAYYFGFEPSDELKGMITELRAAVTAGAELYSHRDKVVKQTVNELIDYVLVQTVKMLPDGDKKNTMLKVTDIVQSTATKLLNQILGKDKNADVEQTLAFFEDKTANTDASGVERLGFEMSPAMFEKMNGFFDQTISSGTGSSDDMLTVFNDFTDLVLQHFLTDFASTLKLGFVKKKLLPVADMAIKKGVKVGNGQLFPQLRDPEKVEISKIYQALLFEA